MFVIYFLLILVGIITVHELGHFIFAKIFGVDVLEFAIGFGPKLYEKKGKKTAFRINLFPIGGYVRLAGEDPMEETQEGIVGLYSKSAWQRLLIFFSGPLFSILAGYALFVIIVGFWGIPSVTVALVEANSPAYEAGLMADDIILSVNGKRVYDTYTVSQIIRQGKQLQIQVLRNGKKITLSAKPKLFDESHFLILSDTTGKPGEIIKAISGKPFEMSNFAALLNQYIVIDFDTTQLKGLLKQYQYDAQRYALGFYFASVSNIFQKAIGPFQEGDQLVSIEDIKIQSSVDLSRIYQTIITGDGGIYLEIEGKKVAWVHEGFPEQLNVEILRDGKQIFLNVSRDLIKQIMESAGVFKPYASNIKPSNFFEAVSLAVDRCNNLLFLMYKTLIGVFRGQEQNGVVGPVGLVSLVGEAVKVGLEQVLTLIAFITMNIGIVNLLPLPALDGGRIVFSLIEIVSRRRVDPKIEGIIHFVGFVILIILRLSITFSDIGRLIGR
ncbi:MAG TPA: peptidase M50 [Pseudothermotoga sp.]|nr:peptidase M50 [Pseudothermotoga sp.]